MGRFVVVLFEDGTTEEHFTNRDDVAGVFFDGNVVAGNLSQENAYRAIRDAISSGQEAGGLADGVFNLDLQPGLIKRLEAAGFVKIVDLMVVPATEIMNKVDGATESELAAIYEALSDEGITLAKTRGALASLSRAL